MEEQYSIWELLDHQKEDHFQNGTYTVALNHPTRRARYRAEPWEYKEELSLPRWMGERDGKVTWSHQCDYVQRQKGKLGLGQLKLNSTAWRWEGPPRGRHIYQTLEEVLKSHKVDSPRKGILGRGKPVQKQRAEREKNTYEAIFNIWVCLWTGGRD